MRLLICGDRNWTSKDMILNEIMNLDVVNYLECIIEGEASGADSIARDIAIELGIPVQRYPANWKEYGRAAGPIRNKQMLQEGKPDLVLAFHHNIEESRGTKNMVNQAKKAGIEVKIVK